MSAESSRSFQNRCNRKQPFSFSKRLYRLLWRIENAFNRLKDFRRVATRYDRLALKLPGLRLPCCRPCMVDLMMFSTLVRALLFCLSGLV